MTDTDRISSASICHRISITGLHTMYTYGIETEYTNYTGGLNLNTRDPPLLHTYYNIYIHKLTNNRSPVSAGGAK